MSASYPDPNRRRAALRRLRERIGSTDFDRMVRTFGEDSVLAAALTAQLTEVSGVAEARNPRATPDALSTHLRPVAQLGEANTLIEAKHLDARDDQDRTPAVAPEADTTVANPMSQGQRDNTRYVTARPRIGRNDPCPCGSGKKYKKCHGADPSAIADLGYPNQQVSNLQVEPVASIDEGLDDTPRHNDALGRLVGTALPELKPPPWVAPEPVPRPAIFNLSERLDLEPTVSPERIQRLLRKPGWPPVEHVREWLKLLFNVGFAILCYLLALGWLAADNDFWPAGVPRTGFEWWHLIAALPLALLVCLYAWSISGSAMDHPSASILALPAMVEFFGVSLLRYHHFG